MAKTAPLGQCETPLREKTQRKKSISGAAYLGIECGATKTVALLETGVDGEVRRGEFGPANLRLLDDSALCALFDSIKTHFGSVTPASLAVAMAGARTEGDRRRIRAAAEEVWPGVRCYATNDLEPALLAAPSSNGIAQVLILSGTGSCCFGRRADGTTLRYGGWGHILGDRGSGYDIGLRAAQAAIRENDRTGKWPALGARLLATLLLNTPDDLIDWARSAGKSEVAKLAVDVFAAASLGDALASAVLAEAAETLAQDGADCAKRLVNGRGVVQFVLAGSVLLKQPAFAGAVARKLRRLRPGAKIVTLEKEAAWGALALARESAIEATVVSAKERDGILPKLTALSPTEQRNRRSMRLHELSLEKAIALMVDEETSIGPALAAVRPQILQALKLIVTALRGGGRLFYVGAGTSGRLGVLDASECPPTFRVPPELVQGIIAGGQTALWSAAEGMEDDPAAGAAALAGRNVNKKDIVMGIAASGRTPFVWGALAEAKKRQAKTIFLSFNPHLEAAKSARPDVLIAADVGPEVLTGSTRLKSGTATKIVLNTLTTLAMVQLGKVLSNLMIDVNPSNEKLRERAIRIVRAVTGANEESAQTALDRSGWIVKDACRKLKKP